MIYCSNKNFLVLLLALLSVTLVGCGGEDKFVGGQNVEEEEKDPKLLNGGAVKGPLINAEVRIYSIDVESDEFQYPALAEQGLRRILFENGVVPSDSEFPESTPAAGALSAISSALQATSYVSNLKTLQNRVENSSSLNEALEHVSQFLAADPLPSEETPPECLPAICETNTSVIGWVKSAVSDYSNLNELKQNIRDIDTIGQLLSEATSYSSLYSMMRRYQSAENDAQKVSQWQSVIDFAKSVQAEAVSLSQIKKDFDALFEQLSGLPAVIQEKNLVALVRLGGLKEDIDAARTIQEVESLLHTAYAKEELKVVVNSLKALHDTIITVDDVRNLVKIDEALKFYEVAEQFSGCGDLAVCAQSAIQALSQAKYEAFDSLLIEEALPSGNPRNRLSLGVSNEGALVEGLKLNDYEGFVYLQALISDDTSDLNGGPKIFEQLDMVFHTNDIKGYGNNSQFDETVYHYVDGVLQRDQDGNLITDISEIEAGFFQTNEVVSVYPHRFATPISKMSFALAKEQMRAGQFSLATPAFDAVINDVEGDEYDLSSYSLAQRLSLFNSDSFAINELLKSSRRVVNESWNITDVEARDFGAESPLVLSHMDIETDKIESVIATRANIEYLASIVVKLGEFANVDAKQIFTELVLDLKDKALDGKDGDQSLPILSSIPNYRSVLSLSPEQLTIPGTEVKVSNVVELVRNQFEFLLPDNNISNYPISASFAFDSPKTGVDSDGNGILDKFDIEGEVLGTVESLYAHKTETVLPFSGGTLLEFPVIQSRGEDASDCAAEEPNERDLHLCIVATDPNINVDASASIVDGEGKASAATKVDVLRDTDGLITSVRLFFDAGVPGEYILSLDLTDNISLRNFNTLLNVTVPDARSLEYRLVSSANPDGAVLEEGVAGQVQFKASAQVCQAYSFCSESDVGEYFDVSLLGSNIVVDWSSAETAEHSGYTRLYNFNDTSNQIANVDQFDSLQANISFLSDSTSYQVDRVNNRAGASLNDLFPDFSNCSSEFDGILNPEINGVSLQNSEGQFIPCFSELVSDTDRLDFVIQMPAFEEEWFYKRGWSFVIRRAINGGEFIGSVSLPSDTEGNVIELTSVSLVDGLNRRLYLAHETGVVYFDFGKRELLDFIKGQDIEALTSLYGSIFVDYPTESRAFDLEGEEVNLNGGLPYPYPGREVSLSIGERFLADVAGDLNVTAELLRTDISTKAVDRISLAINESRKVIPANVTAFGDIVELKLHYTNSLGQSKFLLQELYILGLPLFTANYNSISASSAFEVSAEGSVQLDNDILGGLLSVQWYKYDALSRTNVMIGESKSAPFIIEASNFTEGDFVTAKVVLMKGDSYAELQSLSAWLVDSIQQDTLFEISRSSVEIDEEKGTVTASIRPSDLFAHLYELGLVEPLWFINGDKVDNETAWDFPESLDTVVKFGDKLTFGLDLNLNDLKTESAQIEVGLLELDFENSPVLLKKNLLEVGESVEFDDERYTEELYNDLFFGWYINGVRDEEVGERDLQYPADKLEYGDEIELVLSLDKDFDSESARLTNVGRATVGVNVTNVKTDVAEDRNVLDDDSDGIPNFRDYFRNDANCWVPSEGNPDDTDGDGLTDLLEIGVYSTLASEKDTDGDGLIDAYEVLGTDAYGRAKPISDPLKADTDDDGYTDFVERMLGTDPSSANGCSCLDTDFDGLTDSEEEASTTLVMQRDTDGDGIVDGADIVSGPLNSAIAFNPLNPDIDGDGLADGLEELVLKTAADNIDSDGDNLSDAYELLVSGTDPNVADNTTAEDHSSYIAPRLMLLKDAGEFKFQTQDDVMPGDCYVSHLFKQSSLISAISQGDQSNSATESFIVWGNAAWNYLVIYDLQQSAFLSPISLTPARPANLTSMRFAANSTSELLLGFNDGSIRQVEVGVDAQVPQSPVQTSSQRPEYIVEHQGDLISFSNEGSQTSVEFIGSSFDRQLLSTYLDLDSMIYPVADGAFWALSRDRSLLYLSIDSATGAVSVEAFSSERMLAEDFYYSAAHGSLYFSDGRAFDIASETFSTDPTALPRFSSAFELNGQHYRVVEGGYSLQILAANSAQFDWRWSLNQDLNSLKIDDLVYLDGQAVAIYRDSVNGSLGFYALPGSDSDANGIADWFEQAVPGATLDIFENGFAGGEIVTSPLVLREVLANNEDNQDFDGDGITNAQEAAIGSCSGFGSSLCDNPLDSDGDGLSDFTEYFSILDPSDPDNLGNISLLVTSADADGDGLSDYSEVVNYGTSPVSSDTDSDLICDTHEVHFLDSNPLVFDTDGDSLSDGVEYGVTALNCESLLLDQYSNPLVVDSDADGLSDLEEYNNKAPINAFNRTQALNSDSDGDGFTDKQEIDRGLDPNIADAGADLIDQDADGLSDIFELNVSFTLVDNEDSDGDGLSDMFEVRTLGSNPLISDTDGDGICDYYDRNALTDAEELSLKILSTEDYANLALIQDSVSSRSVSASVIQQLQSSAVVLNEPVKAFSYLSAEIISDNFDGLTSDEKALILSYKADPTIPDADDAISLIQTVAVAQEIRRLTGLVPESLMRLAFSSRDLTQDEIDQYFTPLSIFAGQTLTPADFTFAEGVALPAELLTAEFSVAFLSLIEDSDLVSISPQSYLVYLSDEKVRQNFSFLSSSQKAEIVDAWFEPESSPSLLELLEFPSLSKEIARLLNRVDYSLSMLALSQIDTDVITSFYDSEEQETKDLLLNNATLLESIVVQGIVLGTSATLGDTDVDEVKDAFEIGIDNTFVASCTELPTIYVRAIPTSDNSDGDSLNDGFEVAYAYGDDESFVGLQRIIARSINPLKGDSDNDGLCDHIEVNNLGSNPAEPDTDFDTLSDSWELGFSVDCAQASLSNAQPNTSLILADTDSDGLTDAQELGGHPDTIVKNTDPKDPDTNDDGVLDGYDDTDGDGLLDKDEFNLTGTRFDLADTDGNGITDDQEDADQDGLSNIVEVQTGSCSLANIYTCPDPTDSDGDGISDFDEVRLAEEGGYESNPLSSDSDGDGISDFDEITRVTRNENEICYIDAIAAGSVLEGSGDEIPCPTKAYSADSDMDGLSDADERSRNSDPNYPDTDRDFLVDGIDRFPLDYDADDDSIPDGIEYHVLNTNPFFSQTDDDGLSDGQEVWVYALNNVTDGSEPGLFQIGLAGPSAIRVGIDSRASDTNWGGNPTSDLSSVSAAREVYYLSPIEIVDGVLQDTVVRETSTDSSDAVVYVQYFADPTRDDTDNDGLDDFIELAVIEARFGDSSFIEFEFRNEQLPRDPSCVNTDYDELPIPTVGLFNPNLSNAENFKISDPNSTDSDGNGTLDAYEDADRDFWANVDDQEESKDSVVVSDLDKDCLLDGVEKNVLRINPQSNDSDRDGLQDRLEVSEAEIEQAVPVEKFELCQAGQLRLNNSSGQDYCFTAVFHSYPSLPDSDGDGVVDGMLNETVEGDFYPLDAACSALTDGVYDPNNTQNNYCYSSWLASQADISGNVTASWDDSGDELNYVAFFNAAWDKVVQLYIDPTGTDWSFVPHIDVSNVLSSAVDSDTKRLYLGKSDGSIDYVDLDDNSLVNDFISVGGPAETITQLWSLGTNLLIQTTDDSGLSTRYLYDADANLLGSSALLSEVAFGSEAYTCDSDDCSGVINFYGVSDNVGTLGRVAALSLDISTPAFSVNGSSDVFTDNSVDPGRVLAVSENGQSIYFSDGRQLDTAFVFDIDQTPLVKSYGSTNFDLFYDIVEKNGHFVSIVDEKRPDLPQQALSDKSVFIEDASMMDEESRVYWLSDGEESEFVNLLNLEFDSKPEVFWLSRNAIMIDFVTSGTADLDGDGMPGVFEIFYGLDDSDPTDKHQDLDGDGLTNYEEYIYVTDPSIVDTDNDGLTDLQEVSARLLL